MASDYEEGLKLYKASRYNEALTFLEKAPWKETPEAAYYLMLTLTHLERNEKALYFCDFLLQNESSFLKVLQVRMVQALLLIELKRWTEAEQVLKGLMKEGVESPQIYCAYGFVLCSMGKHREGLKLYNQAIQKDPNNPNALNSMAYTLAEEGIHLEKALHNARRALAARPNSVLYLDTMGWVFHKMNQFKMAQYYLKRALDLDPKNLVIQDHYRQSLQRSTP